jgi:glycosyltransferase involved in cell wall biosynthesis
MPVYNDWNAATELLRRLSHKSVEADHRPKAIIINDGSTREIHLSNDDIRGLDGFESVTILSLGTNLGHQRAIAIGIAYIASQNPVDDVLVMDSDGEDDPADVLKLIAAADDSSEPRLIFALRAKRSEKTVFRIFYLLYTSLFLGLTGYRVRFGNFSFIPRQFIPRLARMPELWNHYAAAIIKSRLPRDTVATARATRLDGVSKMNFVGLVLHGLSAISVFSDVVGVRLLCLSLGFAGIFLLLIGSILAVKLFTDWAIPGWATMALGIATLLFSNAILLAASFVFFTLSNRTANSFVPARDYQTFVEDVSILRTGPT